ncbi:DUF6449 domain-containing protein [Alkaliphilus serpentinus]|uniref:DUF6449 domain-containing protein n=1 Tax=Alkaliphilus serpentinus TaxID=1482731 RepID=A0A833HNV6_9FIRM|nr:DUF6449 domain-containing protein [Alkaliphilus serpentinus]KAB3530049.1 hypothetical protein F8153_08125 [Alkaliphilus serpentinus]
MPLKTSLLNKGIIRNDLKTLYWFPILYTVILFFVVPLQLISRIPHLKDSYPHSHIFGILNFGGDGTQQVLIMTVPVLLALILFSYLQRKNPSDMFHSLPIRRRTLFTSHILVGISFLTVPVIVTGLFTWIVQIVSNLHSYLSLRDILLWAAITMVMNTVMFMSAVFVGTVTGITLVQGVITYIVLFLPMGLLSLAAYNLQMFLYGYSFRFHLGNKDGFFMAISPLYRILNLNSISGKSLIGYIIFSAILYILGSYLYQRRRLENNMQPIVYKNLGYFFKYGVAFSCMLTAGLYFARFEKSIPWVVFGYLIASFLGYFIAEGILQKSFRIFSKKTFISYGIYGAVVAIGLLGINVDLTGYEKKLPPIEEIKGVYFASNFYSYQHREDPNFYEDENIELIREVHEEIIMNKRDVKYNQRTYGRNRGDLYFVYQLENGDEITRSYEGIDLSPYQDKIEAVNSSIEYKKMAYDVLNVEAKDVEKITFRSYEIAKDLVIYDLNEIDELLQLLKDEIINATYEELNDSRIWGSVDLLLKQKGTEDDSIRAESKIYDKATQEYYDGINVTWRKSFDSIDAWLFEKGYLEEARLLPKDVAFIAVDIANSYEEAKKIATSLRENKQFETSDKAEIDSALQNYSNHWGYDNFPIYVVAFYDENDNRITYGSFDQKHVPEFIKAYFEE